MNRSRRVSFEPQQPLLGEAPGEGVSSLNPQGPNVVIPPYHGMDSMRRNRPTQQNFARSRRCVNFFGFHARVT